MRIPLLYIGAAVFLLFQLGTLEVLGTERLQFAFVAMGLP